MDLGKRRFVNYYMNIFIIEVLLNTFLNDSQHKNYFMKREFDSI